MASTGGHGASTGVMELRLGPWSFDRRISLRGNELHDINLTAQWKTASALLRPVTDPRSRSTFPERAWNTDDAVFLIPAQPKRRIS